ncbi:MAG TPA: hypothetical protein VER39_10335 [Nocardioidaceae bacterium]|nr:hypothetical protein [Nocardioidaceae bacterium]
MSAVARPRGPLPARVYWARRLLVTLVALALVLGVARLLGGTADDEPGPSAVPVRADAASSTPSATGSSRPPATAPVPTPATTDPRAGGSRGAAVPLAPPSGRCANSDVVVVPSVTPPAYGGKPVVLTMTLTTQQSPACTWTLSADSLVVKVTSGEDRIWSTQQCPGPVPEQEVVVRRAAAVTIGVAWNGQRSDDECSRSTDWAMPGFYHVTAAAFGAEPRDAQFELVPPVTPTVTRTPTPSPTPSVSSRPGDSASSSPDESASSSRPGAAATADGGAARPSGSVGPSARTPGATPSTR